MVEDHWFFGSIHLLLRAPDLTENMTSTGFFLTLASLTVLGVVAEIPSYIKVCKRNDPDLIACIIDSVEDLRPTLTKGIPELNIPPLEPFVLPELVVSKEPIRAIGTDVRVHGGSGFIIKSLEFDLDKLEIQVHIEYPELRFEALYDVDAKILSIHLHGQGPLQGNATGVEGVAFLKGHKETGNGRTYVKFDSMETKLKLKNYSVKLDNLFNGDKKLGEAVNAALNQNQKELIDVLTPLAEKAVSKVFLSVANNITTHFDFDELFPLS